MKIERTCPFTQKVNVIEIAVTKAQLIAWQAGEAMQRAMPNLNPDEREFIKTGITADVWNEVFKESD